MQDSQTANNNIIDSMDQAFDHHGFYGLEYVLDEWLVQAPPPAYQNKIDSFCFWDFRD